nr:sigma 54-interacting transcriptional regulator [Stigmatella aurantiaca]
MRPIGVTHEVPIDVRLVAATHRDMVAAVREGLFRADLYAQLAQWCLACRRHGRVEARAIEPGGGSNSRAI